MKKRTTGTTASPHPARGPSLYSGDAPGKDPLDGLSILGALEPARSRSRVGRRGVLVMLTVLLLLPATYLVATSSVLRQSIPLLALATPGVNSESVMKSVNAKVPAEPSVTPVPVSTPAPATAEEASAATIVADASAVKPELVGAAAAPPAEPPSVQIPTVMAPEVEQPSEASRQAVPAVASVSPEKSPRRKETKEPAQASTARPKRPESRHAAVAQARPPVIAAKDSKNKESKSKDGKDKDVDLIAALLTHISPRPGSANKEGSQKASGTSASSLSPAQALARQEKNRPTSRDIVVQTAGETKESLISRCRSFGFLEGELCRIRICSGSWGTDPACSMDSGVRGD
jgi:outer membrane biosynthesis protein TonB